MSTQIERDSAAILAYLADRRETYTEGREIAENTGLDPHRINDAIAVLVQDGNVEWIRTFGTAPYRFKAVQATARGRYELQRLEEENTGSQFEQLRVPPDVVTVSLRRPPAPIGSPYGFHDEDWETVARRKADTAQLFIVLGHQFESPHFQTDELRSAVRTMFEMALEDYRTKPGAVQATLCFQALAAGYGEHLFNEIARDIISADIAVFETSDRNPNVMIEMGVALTWGVRVLPIKVAGQPVPPSDISGQTWADYSENGRYFADPEHHAKLIRMIERALLKKGRE